MNKHRKAPCPGRSKTDQVVAVQPWVGILVWALSLASGHQARAQAPGQMAPYITAPAPDDAGFIHARGTITPGHLRSSFTLGSALTLGEFRLRDPDTGAVRRAVHLRSHADLVAQLGLFSRAAIGVEVPLILYQEGESFPGLSRLSPQALADPRVRARFRLLGAVATAAGGRADGPGLAVEATAHLPAGDDRSFAGEGAVRGDLAAIADFQLLGAGAAAHLGIHHRFVHRTAAGVRLRDAMTYGLAFKLPMPFWPALSALLEANGSTQFDGTRTSPLSLRLGARFRFDEWTAQIAGGGSVLGRIAAPEGTWMLSVRYAPAESDSDGDGIPDGSDACPFLPEDIDGFQDDDGCEDPDNDNDLVPDMDDLCPNEEALEGQDADEDGCTDKTK